MSTSYLSEELIAGEVITDEVKLAADTYYRGMTLTYNSGTDRYEYSITPGAVVAVFAEEATRIVASNDSRGTVIIGGSVNKAGLTNDSGAAQTITDAIIAQAAQDGLYIKR